MIQEHFDGKVGVRALIPVGGKILLVRGPGDEKWDLPGGRVHLGEDLTSALVREIREELGTNDILPGPLFHSIQDFHAQDKRNQFFLCFRVKLLDESTLRIPSDEIAEIRWIAKGEMSSVPMYRNCQEALKSYWGLD